MADAAIWTGRAIRFARPVAYVSLAILAVQSLAVIALAADGAYTYTGAAQIKLELISATAAAVRLVLVIAAAILVWVGRSRFVTAARLMLLAFPVSVLLQQLAEGMIFHGLGLSIRPFVDPFAMLTYVIAAWLVFAAMRAPAYAEATLQSLASGFD